MYQYPRISVRLKEAVKLRLRAMALENKTKPSKLVQTCIECILGEPTCKARQKILKGQRKEV